MVIGVLSVLLAIVLPTIKTVHAHALRKQAQTGATALAQAAIRYKTEYGFWPGQLEANDNDDTVRLDPDHASYKNVSGIFPAIVSAPKEFTDKLDSTTPPIPLNTNEVYQAFRCIGRKDTALFKPNPLNPKGIHFLDLQDELERTRVNFPDPWGRGYILFMGLNPRSTFTHKINFPNGGSQIVSVDNAIAFAFSYGPDGDRSTNYIYSAGVKP